MDLLRHLRFFAAVAETRHFGDAARTLGMTQPPLSQGVQRLEERLGVRLFDRDARGVRITAAGALLLPRARALLRDADDLLERAREVDAPQVLRLGVATDLDDLAVAVVRSVSRAVGAVTTRPRLGGSVELTDALREGDLDAALVRHPGVLDGLVGGPVLVVPTRLELPDGLAPAGLGGLDLPLAVPPRHEAPAAHDQVVDALRLAGHDGGVVEAATRAERRALVAAGLAATTTPAEDGGAPPLRVRLAFPLPARRTSAVDTETVGEAVARALGAP